MKITLFMLLLLSVLLTSQQPAEKPTYSPTGNEARLVGTIMLKGTPPKNKFIDMTADPSCPDIDHKPQTESVISNQGRLANVFVYVKAGDNLDAYRFAVPESDVILNQRACYFEPHVLGLQVGQNLRILNSDPTFHNVHPTPKSNPEWNQTQVADAPPLVKTFRRAEVMIPIKCNQHPWMKAYVGVLNHPFFAVSDRLGRFEIRGLPPGTYKLAVWHELFGFQEIDVTLVTGESRNADFTFDLDNPGQTVN